MTTGAVDAPVVDSGRLLFDYESMWHWQTIGEKSHDDRGVEGWAATGLDGHLHMRQGDRGQRLQNYKMSTLWA